MTHEAQTPQRVLWVGPAALQPWSDVVAAIREDGFEIEVPADRAELLGVLRRYPRAPVVVCKTGDRSRVDELLGLLGEFGRFNPVLVLVDRPEFGDYYDLMHRGASYYYEASEEPGRIAQAVNWAAGGMAAQAASYVPSE